MSDGPKILESPEDVLSTLHADGRRRWMYPVLSKGGHLKQRFVVAWVLIVFFVALPMISVGGKPAIFLDIMQREFTFFGLTLYATDTLLLMLFLLSAFMFVIWFTALFGRVWCGWACPQTVYMEFVYRPIERFFEGKESQRKRRDEGPLTGEKFIRKFGKYAFYLVISAFLAHTFVAYFVSWDALLNWMTSSPTDHWGFFVMMAGTTGLMLFNFSYFREQMCTIACPYARIQSVLQDRDSMIVSYVPSRGEARGRRTKEQRKAEKAGEDIGLGDCIDCNACVRTCPTGIDIRDGLQMECIGCTQCIDACNNIMDGIGKPHGLIKYTSENALEGGKSSMLRGRTIVYTLFLTILISAFTYQLLHRVPVEVNVGRVVAKGQPLFSTLDGGQVMNRLRFRVQNRTGDAATFEIKVLEPAGAEIKNIGQPQIQVGAGETKRVEAFVVVPADKFVGGSVPGKFQITNSDGSLSAQKDFVLLGPSTQAKP